MIQAVTHRKRLRVCLTDPTRAAEGCSNGAVLTMSVMGL
jgi:hypothetical protein